MRDRFKFVGTLKPATARKNDDGTVKEREAGTYALEISNPHGGTQFPKVSGKKGMEKPITVKKYDDNVKEVVRVEIAWKDRNVKEKHERIFDDSFFIYNDGVETIKYLHRFDLAEKINANIEKLAGKEFVIEGTIEPWVFNGKAGFGYSVSSIRPATDKDARIHTGEIKLYFTSDSVPEKYRNTDDTVNLDFIGEGIPLKTFMYHKNWTPEKTTEILIPYPTVYKVKPEMVEDEMMRLKAEITLEPFSNTSEKIYSMGYETIMKKEATSERELTEADLTKWELKQLEARIRTMEDFKKIKVKSTGTNTQVLITVPSFVYKDGVEHEASLKTSIFEVSEAVIKGEDVKKVEDKEEIVIPGASVTLSEEVKEEPKTATEEVFGSVDSPDFPF